MGVHFPVNVGDWTPEYLVPLILSEPTVPIEWFSDRLNAKIHGPRGRHSQVSGQAHRDILSPRPV
jgi:hypothetical protein